MSTRKRLALAAGFAGAGVAWALAAYYFGVIQSVLTYVFN